MINTSINILTEILKAIGIILLGLGGVFEIIGAIGIVGGTITPLIGISIISIAEYGLNGLYLATMCIITAMLILITAPTGSHLLVRASYILDYKMRGQINSGKNEKTDQGR
ncbi:MAG: hypothetical protein QXE81_01780 [Desulfurococcaceae archaeon]